MRGGAVTWVLSVAASAPTSCVARPSGEELPLDELRGRRVVLLSAIARPQSFRATVERLGCVVAAELVHRDHHCFRADELALAAATAQGVRTLKLWMKSTSILASFFTLASGMRPG